MEQGYKKNHVPSVSNRLSNFRVTNNSYITYRCITTKHTIPVSIIRDLLLIIKKNHETRNPRNLGFY
jgi:hypothetical protein